MRRLSVAVLIVLLIGALNCFAELVPIATIPNNLVPLHGTGFGSVETLLNAQNTSGSGSDGLEANCDIIGAGVVSGGNATSSCSGPFAGMPGGLNDPANQNTAWSLSSVGITDYTTAAQQILLVFNINQTGSDQTLNLLDIGLALWFNGNPIFSALSARDDTYSQILQGVGQAGFGYELNGAEATAAQTAINNAIAAGATLNNILVTGAFRAGCPAGVSTGCGNDGPDALFLDSQGAPSVPDGGMTVMLLGGALVGLETLRRRFRA